MPPAPARSSFRELSSAHAPDVPTRRRIASRARAVRDPVQDDARGGDADSADPAPLRLQTGSDRPSVTIHSGSDAGTISASTLAARADCGFHIEAQSVSFLNWLA